MPNSISDDRSLLYRLASRQDEATPQQAALAYLEGQNGGRSWLAPEVARAINFRAELVESWPDRRVAQNITAVPFRTIAPRALDFLKDLHFGTRRRQMLADFLDGLALDHDFGALNDQSTFASVDEASVRSAAAQLVETYDRDEVLVYLLTLQAQKPGLAGLNDWIRDEFADPTRIRGEPAAAMEPEEQEPSLQSFGAMDEFTTLDQRLVYSVVETAQRVEGAATEDELDDLIEEVIQLNRSRQRSYFHAGFRDAVFEREIPRREREMNEQRARWYWAGVVNGLSRRKAWKEITDWYDADASEAHVKSLGDTGKGPSYAAGQLVVLALCRTGRAPEAAEFVKVEALIHCDRLFFTAFREASQLLREDGAAEARGLLERHGHAVDIMESRGTEPDSRMILEVRRRRAHCYRQLKEFARASSLLDRLRRDEPDPDLLSMILADLGLIEGGFRNLADIRLPARANGIDDLRGRLEKGREFFQEAVDLDTEHSAHARFALGMLELAKGADYGAAADRLELAKAVFATETKRYGTAGFLARADLALGIALANDLRHHRMQAAHELIVNAMKKGAEMPPWAVVSTLECFGLYSADLASRTAAAMVEHSEADLLDRVVEASSAALSPPVTEALLQRARDPNRGSVLRAGDFRIVLPGLLQERAIDKAEECLDYLESAALAGEGVDEFLELLSQPERYQPAWNREDALWARVHCLEAAGMYDSAARLLEEAFHRLLVEPLAHNRAQAEDLLDRVNQYGLAPAFTSGMRARLEAIGETGLEESGPASAVQVDVRILFVGGNETQTQYDGDIVGELQKSHPNVSVSFIHPGWSSNWMQYYEAAERKMSTHDGLVVMRFIRTQFGRRLRKLAGDTDTPWWSCTGSGKRSMRASILAAAALAQDRARARVLAKGGK